MFLLVILHAWPVFLGLAIPLGLLYGVYWFVWTLVVRPKTPALAMVLEPPRERLTELIGSLLVSALAVAVMSVVMVLIESYRADAVNVPRPEQFAWLLLVGGFGAWSVLITSKFWEGRRGEALLRRFLLMVIGLGVGLVAFGLSEMLMVSLPPAAGYPKPPAYRLPASFYAVDGRPLLMAYVACFGTLFLLIGWWRQTDPVRSTRLSLGKLILSVVAAAVVASLWQFPQPWLPMVAGTISVSVQLASPRIPSGKRLRPSNRYPSAQPPREARP